MGLKSIIWSSNYTSKRLSFFSYFIWTSSIPFLSGLAITHLPCEVCNSSWILLLLYLDWLSSHYMGQESLIFLWDMQFILNLMKNYKTRLQGVVFFPHFARLTLFLMHLSNLENETQRCCFSPHFEWGYFEWVNFVYDILTKSCVSDLWSCCFVHCIKFSNIMISVYHTHLSNL